MAFIFIQPPKVVRIRKAVRKTTRTYKRVEALSRQMGKAVQVDILHGIKKFKKRIPAEAMMEAWKAGKYDSVMHFVPWEDMHYDMDGFHSGMESTLGQSANFSVRALPSPVQSNLRFDTKNPNIQRWLNNRTGNLIVDIKDDARDTVRQVVRRAMNTGMSPRDVADNIRDSIGLLPRQENALWNYRAKLIKDGVHSEDKIDRLTSAYSDRLLTQRTTTIARTETRFAANQGQLAVWREAANQDLIDRHRAKKVWIVDGNPCDICEPMDGVAAPLDGFWTLNNGDVVENPTDSHPNCYCGMELDFGDSASVADSDDDDDEEI